MGISDDIAPRHRRIEPKHHQKPKPKQLHEVKEVEEADPIVHIVKKVTESAGADDLVQEKSDRDEMSDSFFSKTMSPAKTKDKSTRQDFAEEGDQIKPKVAGWILFAFVIVLAIILVYQNFSEIKRFLLHEKAAGSAAEISNTVVPTYTGDVQSQDYTSDTTPENTTSTPVTSGSTTTTTTPAATTATSTIDKSTIKIKLLNGNGITGSAASVKQTLQTAGFTISTVTNARNFNYASTIIYYKTGKTAEAELAATALASRSVTKEVSDSITGTFDLVIVIGKK